MLLKTEHSRDIPVTIQAPQANIAENTDDIFADSSEQLTDEGIAGADDGSDSSTAVAQVPHTYIVSSGDSLSSILTQFGIDSSDIATIANQNKDLRNLKIGQPISWKLDDDGLLQELSWGVSRRETRVYTRTETGFTESKEFQKGELKNSVTSGVIRGSFSNSATNAGLTSAEARAVTKALQWQIDFKKLQSGDKFSALFSREVLDGRTEQSELIGVRLRSAGKDYYAFLAEDGRYYDSKAGGLERGFMRFPTAKQFRVSSQFNPRRVNPVTGRISPHKGVDFAMPVGTPVLATGDGEVIVAKYSGAAGNFVAIRHGSQYTTRYMHLRQLLVKPGQRVKRGDRIALSGNTGRSTGPHLHYELWINQQAVNPLTAKLPRADGLTGKDKLQYLTKVKEVMPQLTFND
ncbi:M23/M37 family cell wall endopeptidase [Proteus myxofaciens ATCC 19692]|uniref:M23/M37 family cell wall endopeptidase n=2 Tax=Proteus myxofaciens TaxID=184072 RepID=A0A198GP99_9GAMM|nr:M23/M37 family cell wall endopeptidase [Proteus myxofaciens ATCC 19692]